MAENNQGVINALKQSQVEGARVIKDELKESFKPFADQLMAPLQAMQAGINSLPGVGVTKKLFSAVSKPLKASFNADSKTSAKEQKQLNADERDKDKNQTLMEDIRDGIFGLKDGLLAGLAGLKDKGLMGLGLLAGLVAAPFVAISAFFTQLGKELLVLKKAGEFIFIKPFNAIKTFFTNLGTKFTNSKVVTYFDDVVKSIKTFFTTVGTNIKNSKVVGYFDDALKGVKTFFSTLSTNIGNSKVVGYFDDVVLKTKSFFSGISTTISNLKAGGLDKITKIGDSLKSVGASISKAINPIVSAITGTPGGGPGGAGGTKGVVGSIKSLFNPVKTVLNSVKSSAALVTPFMDGFKLVTKFAAGIGTTLGKFFLPITILMGVYDAITGFMSGYKDAEGGTGEKIFAGVKEGLAKVITSLIGLPLDLLKKGLTYLITFFFGESVVTKSLESFSFADTIGKMVRLPFDLIKGAYNWIKTLFVDPKTALAELWTALVGEGGLIQLLFKPIDMAIAFVKGLFGFKPKEGEEEFSIGKLVTDAITSIYEWFKGLLSIDVGKIVESIPGASTVLKALGIIDESPAEKAKNIKTAIAEAQNRITRSEGGENVYFGREGVGQSDDKEEIASLQQELLELQSQNKGTTIINQIDNSTNNSGNSSNQTLSSTQLVDGAAPAGAKMD